MKRNFLWCFLSFFPLICVAILMIGGKVGDSNYPGFLKAIPWLASNWWKLFGALMVGTCLFFLFHSLIRRHFIWTLIIIFFLPLATPMYWFFITKNNSNK